MNTHRFPYLCLGILVSILLFSACNKDGLTKKEKKELFATPTVAETDAIRAEWAARNLTPTDG